MFELKDKILSSSSSLRFVFKNFVGKKNILRCGGEGGRKSFLVLYIFITSTYDILFNFESSLGKKEKKCDERTNGRTDERTDEQTDERAVDLVESLDP